MNAILKLVLPVAAFAMASAGAVSTNESAKLAPETGWRRVAMNDCISPVTCNGESSTLCTIGGFQRYKKVGLDCVEPLFHKPN